MPIFLCLIQLAFLLMLPAKALAITDPLAVPNNKLGIHVLFPDEIEKASFLVNNDRKGEWGYIVIPIQSSDRDRDKWQKFFDKCKELKMIPIIRVATVATGPHWDSPTNFDFVDFANFLNDLRWPVQNRYVAFFNEVNRADEYGGVVSPENYADDLNTAIDIFKAKSVDFFILPAGLDNAASDRKSSLKWNVYLQRMHARQPDIFNKIDGWVSHAYPNPDFSSRPDISGENKLDSFIYDLKLIAKYTDKKLPIFITETGWSNKYLSDRQQEIYYKYAFDNVWDDPRIVTVAPFLFNAQDGPFTQFSFLNKDHNFKSFAAVFSSYSSKGEPIILPEPTPTASLIYIAPEATSSSASGNVLGIKTPSGNIFKKLYNSLKDLFDFLN